MSREITYYSRWTFYSSTLVFKMLGGVRKCTNEKWYVHLTLITFKPFAQKLQNFQQNFYFIVDSMLKIQNFIKNNFFIFFRDHLPYIRAEL